MDYKQTKRYLILVIFILYSSIAVVSTSDDDLKCNNNSVKTTTTSNSEWTTEITSTEISILESSPSSENPVEKNEPSSLSSSSSEEEDDNKNRKIVKKTENVNQDYPTSNNSRNDTNMQTQLILSRDLIRHFQREIQNLKNYVYLYKRSLQLEIDSVHEKLRVLNISLDNNNTNPNDNNRIQNENTKTKLTIYQLSSQIQSIQYSIQEIKDELVEQRGQLENFNKTSEIAVNKDDRKLGNPTNLMRMTQQNYTEMDSLKKTLEEQKIELNEMKKALKQVQKNSNEQRKQIENLAGIHLAEEHPKDCMDIIKWRKPKDNPQMNETSKMNHVQYLIYPLGSEKESSLVECDGDWTVIQQRRSGPREQFYRNWTEYEQGFYTLTTTNNNGSDAKDPLGNYWIGLKVLESLTRLQPQELRIELTDWDGESRFAHYSHFSISNATDFYRLFVANYSGNAGDSLSYHNQSQFSTWDQDNDDLALVNCAQQFHGGWWYKACLRSNLNGLYRAKSELPAINADALVWEKYKGLDYSLRIVQMKIRPRRNSENIS